MTKAESALAWILPCRFDMEVTAWADSCDRKNERLLCLLRARQMVRDNFILLLCTDTSSLSIEHVSDIQCRGDYHEASGGAKEDCSLRPSSRADVAGDPIDGHSQILPRSQQHSRMSVSMRGDSPSGRTSAASTEINFFAGSRHELSWCRIAACETMTEASCPDKERRLVGATDTKMC